MKKIFSIMLSLVFCLSVMPLTAVARAATSGDWEYSISNNAATVTKYNGTASNVTIPDTLDGYQVVAIGPSAFKDNNTIVEVVISDNVTSIATQAFEGCAELVSIALSSTLKSIETFAFRRCSKLSDIVLPKTLMTIYAGAFWGCSSLTSVEIPASLTTVGFTYSIGGIGSGSVGAFQDTNITEAQFEDGMTTVPPHIFYNCNTLKNVFLPDSITSIGIGAFRFCAEIEGISLPKALTTIETFAFSGCSKLSDIVLPKTLTAIHSGAFLNCSSLTNIEIPKSLTLVGYDYSIVGLGSGNAGVFQGTGIADAQFEEGMTTVPSHMFYNCSTLKNVFLPDSITSIGIGAFRYCTEIERISLPKALTTIETFAFSGCSKLSDIVLPKTLTAIHSGAFLNCSSLTNIEIPKSLTLVGYNYSIVGVGSGNAGVFQGTNITDAQFENGMTIVPSYVFFSCNTLRTIAIPQSVVAFGSNIFSGCENFLDSVYTRMNL
ncbi:MAG: leucine-rich repeat domain-containing protein [Clostridiales bacterium]|nr:leucine-rich repeat domain-containing protein [Clostridiales bacterium]